MRQEHRLNTFHMRCLRRILGIKWQDRVSNSDILTRAGILSIYSFLSQRRLRWLGHVRRMGDGRIPKDVLYGQLTSGNQRVGRPALRYKGVCKHDMKTCNTDTADWETVADDRLCCRQKVKQGIRQADINRGLKASEKRERRKLSASTVPTTPSGFNCPACSRDCRSRIGLFSHARRFSSTTDHTQRGASA